MTNVINSIQYQYMTIILYTSIIDYYIIIILYIIKYATGAQRPRRP